METTLLSLPPELHLQIAYYLPYPDALSLKHTSRHFYNIVDTGIKLKVAWLVERKRLLLDCPRRSCIVTSDETFCSPEIRRLMEKRRWHEECKPGECLVVSNKKLCGAQGWSKRMDRVVSALLDYATVDRRIVKEAIPFGGAWLLALVLAAVYWWYVGDQRGRSERVTADYGGHWIL
ncbi:MAG: hypothetical protein M1835_000304 [Candelina submexicana]|nr:MAG: hypothetical protein M1835_000304 [Candelina submexicana]